MNTKIHIFVSMLSFAIGITSVKYLSRERILNSNSIIANDWVKIPTQSLRESNGVGIVGILLVGHLADKDTESQLMKLSGASTTESTQLSKSLFNAMESWAGLVNPKKSNDVNSGAKWTAKINKQEVNYLLSDLDNNINAILGNKKAHVFKCVILKEFTDLFDANVIEFETGANSVTLATDSSNLGVFDTDNLDSHSILFKLLLKLK